MRTTIVKIQRWGDGLAVRLPSTVVRAGRLAPGQSIEVSYRGGVITMQLAAKKDTSLRDRVRVIEHVRNGAQAMVSRMR